MQKSRIKHPKLLTIYKNDKPPGVYFSSLHLGLETEETACSRLQLQNEGDMINEIRVIRWLGGLVGNIGVGVIVMYLTPPLTKITTNICQFKIKILMKLGEGLFNGKITKHLI